jgi:transposase-like protein
MQRANRLPKTLLEAIRYFADLDVATEFLASLRWPKGPVCPKCGMKKHSYLKSRRVWKCAACKKQFSVKVGTIFEDSPIGLDKWLAAVWMIANSKNGVSSHELGRSLGVTQKTAWFMLHRIRLAMRTRTFEKLSGGVEVDETFIGGKARNMHVAKRKQKITGATDRDKAVVMGVRSRDGQVRAKVVSRVQAEKGKAILSESVEPGSTVYSDSNWTYKGVTGIGFNHQVINHAESYVDGQIHINGIENFWSLLKRGLHGTYISVEPFHLFRYLDEQVHRYNNREADDSARFVRVLRSVSGRRLTYAEVTGKVAAL